MHKKLKLSEQKRYFFAFTISKIFDILKVIKMSYTVRIYSLLKYKFR